MFSSLLSIFWKPKTPDVGAALYRDLIAPGRLAALLVACRQPDTFTGRFETLALAAALRLEGAAPTVKRDLINALVRDIDVSFRERSLGDASVKKHATNHAAAFYGRLNAYAGNPDEATLRRNLFADDPTPEQEAALPTLLTQVKDALK